MKYNTSIDTVALQLDFTNAKEQRDKLSLLRQWIIIRELGLIELDYVSQFKMKYNVYCSGVILFTIDSGFTSKKDKSTNEFVKQYYIRIRFAGLKSYRQNYDDASVNALMTICAFLNTTRTNFRLVELDVAIDLNCRFNNVLAVCMFKSSKTTYNRIGYTQYFKNVPTSYIERYCDATEAKNAVLRAYLYDKSAKENILYKYITRFELKLQNRFFLKNSFTEQSIINALDRYYVMYFENPNEKEWIINNLDNNSRLTPKEINKLNLVNYRVRADVNVIKIFISEIKSVYVSFYGDIVCP